LAGNDGHDTGLARPTNADGGAGLKAHGSEHGPIVGIELLFNDYAAFAGSHFAEGYGASAALGMKPGGRGNADWGG